MHILCPAPLFLRSYLAEDVSGMWCGHLSLDNIVKLERLTEARSLVRLLIYPNGYGGEASDSSVFSGRRTTAHLS